MSCIAVVEDNEELRDLLAEVLTDDGYEVVALTDRSDVIGRLASVHPDLVILDLLLGPDASAVHGWQLVEMVRRDPRLAAIPILVCSGDTVALRESSARNGSDPFVACLSKPFSLSELEDAISRLTFAAGRSEAVAH